MGRNDDNSAARRSAIAQNRVFAAPGNLVMTCGGMTDGAVRDPLAMLRRALPQTAPDTVGRDDFTRGPRMAGLKAPVAAAVLVPVIARPAPSLLFTRRTATLSRHSGQVSFPGGRSEAGDPSPVATALRETCEETGIDPALVQIAGFLPRYLTGTGFDIRPVVGVLAEGFALTPDPREVAETFEVPLAFFLDPANRRQGERIMAGEVRRFDLFTPGPHYIWGVTAALLVDLARHLAKARAMDGP
jgi:8-oxo-dGTP pyrophosphatase MutT (NUDIX family)